MGGNQYIRSNHTDNSHSCYKRLCEYIDEFQGERKMCGCFYIDNTYTHVRDRCWVTETVDVGTIDHYLCDEHFKCYELEKTLSLKRSEELQKQRQEEANQYRISQNTVYTQTNKILQNIEASKKLKDLKDNLKTLDRSIEFKKDGTVYIKISFQKNTYKVHKLCKIIKEDNFYKLKDISLIITDNL